MSTRYGFLNGIPIDPGAGWEIVPEDGVITTRADATKDGNAWFEWLVRGLRVKDCLAGNPPILAFRRPITQPVAASRVSALRYGEERDLIAKQTVQAGQGESAPDLSGMIAIGAERQGIGIGGMVEEKPRPMFAGNTRALVDKINQLQKLTAAQSVALEKAEPAITKAIRVVREHPDIGGEYPNLADEAYQLLKESLTLIQQAKESGK